MPDCRNRVEHDRIVGLTGLLQEAINNKLAELRAKRDQYAPHCNAYYDEWMNKLVAIYNEAESRMDTWASVYAGVNCDDPASVQAMIDGYNAFLAWVLAFSRADGGYNLPDMGIRVCGYEECSINKDKLKMPVEEYDAKTAQYDTAIADAEHGVEINTGPGGDPAKLAWHKCRLDGYKKFRLEMINDYTILNSNFHLTLEKINCADPQWDDWYFKAEKIVKEAKDMLALHVKQPDCPQPLPPPTPQPIP